MENLLRWIWNEHKKREDEFRLKLVNRLDRIANGLEGLNYNLERRGFGGEVQDSKMGKESDGKAGKEGE